NTGRSTLTTGSPVIADDGRLQGFNVQGGAVDISGAGINASNIDRFDIITRSLALNAALHGNEVNLVLGKQQVAYADLAVTDAQTDDDAPTLALDSTALGGIYADRIRLLSSEQGVGVKLSAPIAAQTGDVTLDVNGNLRFNDITSGGDLDVTAVSVQTGDDAAVARDGTPGATRLVSGGHIDIATDADAELDDTLLLAGNGIKVQAGADLIASASEMRSVKDVGLEAAGILELDADSTLVTNSTLSLEAKSLDGWSESGLSAEMLKVASIDDLVINSEMSLYGDASLSTQGALGVTGGMYLPGSLDIKANSLHSDGELVVYKDLAISVNEATNLGLWYSGGEIIVDVVSGLVNGDAEHTAAIYSAENILVRDKQDVMATEEESSEDSGNVQTISTLVNSRSLIQADGHVTLNVDHIDTLRHGEEYAKATQRKVNGLERTSDDRNEQVITTTTEYLVDEGRVSEIISGGDITIDGYINNRMSLVFAIGDVSIEDGMSNEDLVMRRFISDYVYDWDYKKRYGRKKWRRAKTISAKSWSEDTGEALFATVYANGDIYLKGEDRKSVV